MARISCTIKKKIFAVATYLTDVKLLRTNAGNLIPDRFITFFFFFFGGGGGARINLKWSASFYLKS